MHILGDDYLLMAEDFSVAIRYYPLTMSFTITIHFVNGQLCKYNNFKGK